MTALSLLLCILNSKPLRYHLLGCTVNEEISQFFVDLQHGLIILAVKSEVQVDYTWLKKNKAGI